MRIFLLPISTRQALIYCQTSARQSTAPLSIVDRITNKATETWAKWEEADRGWQKTIVRYGNAGLQRIPFQEWGLKSFPPAKPKLQAEHLANNKKIDVFFPGNVMRKEDVPKTLLRLARERKNLHWNRFIGSMIAMPITIPFALIPVIPNIPFFYAAYRCWSHWRALKGSDHLQFILDNRLYRPVSTEKLEELYEKVAPDAPDYTFITRSQVLDGTAPKETLILPSGNHNLIAKTLGVPELSSEVERAVWQVENVLRKEASQQEVRKDAQQANETRNDVKK